MYTYKIIRAVAIKRFDLVVNGITITCSEKKQEVEAEAAQLIRKGYLKG